MSLRERPTALREAATNTTLLRNLRDDRCHERFQASWREFYRKYAAVIVHWCEVKWGLESAAADDVAAEVMIKILRNIKHFRYRKDGSFRAWIFTVTRRATIDYWNSERRFRMTHGRNILDRLPARDDLIQRLQEEFDLELLGEARRRVARKVSERDWSVFIAVSENGRDVVEVAEQYGLRRNNIYTIKGRIMEKIREELHELETNGICP